MCYAVFHHQPLYPYPVNGETCLQAKRLGWPEKYVKVAVVKAGNLEEVFRKTQHLDFAWHNHPDIETIKMSRSTSIGDVVLDQGGQLWVVATFGFTKLTSHLAVLPNPKGGPL